MVSAGLNNLCYCCTSLRQTPVLEIVLSTFERPSASAFYMFQPICEDPSTHVYRIIPPLGPLLHYATSA